MADLWGTDDSSGSSTPSEQDQAQKRALTLGVIATGLGLLSARRQWGQSRGEALRNAIGQAGQAGLETYLGSETASQQSQMQQQKAALEAAQAKQNLTKGNLEIQQAQRLAEQNTPVGQAAVDRITKAYPEYAASFSADMPKSEYYKALSDMRRGVLEKNKLGNEVQSHFEKIGGRLVEIQEDKLGNPIGRRDYGDARDPEVNAKLAASLNDRMAARSEGLITRVNANPKLDQAARQKLVDDYNADITSEAAQYKADFGVDVKPRLLSIAPATKGIIYGETPGDVGPAVGGPSTDPHAAAAGSVVTLKDGRKFRKQADGSWKAL